MQQLTAREIGQRIGQARREAGLTQEELSELGSFSKRSLQDYESGITIPYRQMRELSRLLARPVDWLLYGNDDDTDQLAQQLERIENLITGLAADVADIKRRQEGGI